MNKVNAHLYLPLIQALAEGKTIQVYLPYNKTWVDKDNLKFDSPPDQYRIKPEPIKQDFYYIRHKTSSGNPPKEETIMYGYNNLQTAKEHLKKIDPNGTTYVIMHAKAEQVLQ